MKKTLFTTLLALLAFTSCDKEGEAVKDDDKTTTDRIEIFLDTQAISIDKGESATFRVMLNDTEDISDKATIYDITGGGFKELKSLTFTTLRPGIHTFFAGYNNLSSSQISLSANSESNLSSTFYRRNVVFKFTGIQCPNCPRMTTAIELAKYKYPDRLIEIAIHSYNNDPLATNAGNALTSFCKIFGYPYVVFDLDKNHQTGESIASLLVENAQAALTENPTVVGIDLKTKVTDRVLNIDFETTFTADGEYKFAVALLQSGFNYSQAGTDDETYRQNHVLRGFFQNDVMGENLGERVAQEKYQGHYEYALPDELTDEELAMTSVVVYVLNNRGDAVYTVNNAAECLAGESSPYQFEPIIEE